MTRHSTVFVGKHVVSVELRMSTVECPYHHPRWRNRTQQLLNALRRKVLSPSLVKRFSTVACVCPGKGNAESPKVLDTLPDLFHWLHSNPHSIPVEAHSILEQYLNMASQQPDEQGAGLVGVVSIIKEAVNDKQGQASLHEKPREEQWSLSLPHKYLGLLIGRGGCNVKPLCDEHGISAFFGDRQRIGRHQWRHFESFKGDDKVKVTVVAKANGEDGNFEAFKQKLEERAKSLKAKQEKHEAAVCGYHRSRREWLRVRTQQYLQRGAVRVRPSVGVHRNSKEAATDHYERKQHQKTKTKHPSRSMPHAAICEGRCLNCLAPYSPNQTNDGACTFHAGFLTAVKTGKKKGYNWTCCGRRTAAQRATVDLHTRTGCCSGRHTWRAGRGGTRKTRDGRHTYHTDIIVI